MIDKLKKLKRVINSKGIQLSKPSHWLKLIKQGYYFLRRNGKNSTNLLRERYNRLSNVTVNTPQTHAQIWERIKPTHVELTKMYWAIPNLKKHYHFTIVVDREDIDTISSIEKQVYDKLEILIGTPQETLKNATGDYVMFLQAGDYLHKNALFEMVVELNMIGKTPSVLYFDHDYAVNGVVDKPYYKPGWSPDLLLVNNYINRACLFRRDLLSKIEIESIAFYAALYDITLKLAELEAGHHRPGILLTLPDANDERAYDPLENAVREKAIKRRGINGVIERNKYGVASLKRQVQGNPKVSIIIPTCYTKTFVEDCLKSIERVTTYKNYEVIIVDNSRKDQSYGQERLKGYNCKILYVHEPFNWSRLNNLGAKEATGDILLFLNDDTEILTPDWLERMAAEAQRPEIGMVGPMILFPDGSVQSAGVFSVSYGNGGRHSFITEKESFTQYHNYLHYTRASRFIMGACFAVEKKKLADAGGFDERFPLVCNEQALAFSLMKNNCSNLTMAEVKITHFEKASRGNVDEGSHDRLLWDIWREEITKKDIFFNPYLDSYQSDYSIDNAPTISRLFGTPSISSVNVRKVIIVKLDHIGDVVLSLPSIRKIRKVFPNAQVDVLCGSWAKGLLEQQPEIDNVHTFNFFQEKSGGGLRTSERDMRLREAIESLKKEKYDLAINLRRNPETKHISIQLADFCLAYSTEPEDESFSHPMPSLKCISSSDIKWNNKDQLLSLCNTLEYDETLDQEISVPLDVKNKVNDYISNNGFYHHELLIGLHLGSGDDAKEWPIESFQWLCDFLIERLNAKIVLFGGNGDKVKNDGFIEHLRHKDAVISVAGDFSLLEFCHLVRKVDYYIGNDSGPGHIAGIQGVPTLLVFCSRASTAEWTPIGKAVMQIERSAICKPCYGLCPNRDCLTKIRPSDVYDGFLRLMTLFPSIRER